MSGIELKNGRLLYYGSPAGYQDGLAVMADPIFYKPDLIDWLADRRLSVRWEDGLYDRLSSGQWPNANGEQGVKSCRIWQLRADAPGEVRFLPLDELRRRCGEPCPALYQLVYEGHPGTDELEVIWDKFCRAPLGDGHPLSISDVVELYDSQGSVYFYCDRTAFQPICFEAQQQTQAASAKLEQSL